MAGPISCTTGAPKNSDFRSLPRSLVLRIFAYEMENAAQDHPLPVAEGIIL